MTAQGLFRARGRIPTAVAVRVANDFYPTPPAPVELLLRVEGDRLRAIGGPIWEPCAGDGAIVDVLQANGFETIASDINPHRADIERRDLFDVTEPPADLVLTNPPFGPCSPRAGGAPLVGHLLGELTVRYLGLLLPAGWLRATIRREFLRRRPPARIIPIVPRVDWDGRGSPAADHSWFVWDSEHRGPTVYLLPEVER